MKVIPVINAKTFNEAQTKIKLIEPYVEWVQLDVADGSFTENITWHEPKDLNGLKTSLKFEAHLMLGNLEDKISPYLTSRFSRLVFHLETAREPLAIIDQCRQAGKQVGAAICFNTPLEKLLSLADKVDLLHILAVTPGLAGQKFKEESLRKIISLRQYCPKAIIEVDGGINREIAEKLALAGANIVNVASYIFNSQDIKKAIDELENIT